MTDTGRPLLITDCDEVLLHMVAHFRDWLGEHRGIDFTIGAGDFARSMTRREGTDPLSPEEMWALLGDFFPDEMGRQTLVPGAAEALAALSKTADIVVLTNLADGCRQPRIDQLARFGIHHRVECNQGGKGMPVGRLVEEYRPSVAVFVDDLAVHHESVAKRAPDVHRLHMVSEPLLAAAMPPAAHAHARIDEWAAARDWIGARFAAGVPAPQEELA